MKRDKQIKTLSALFFLFLFAVVASATPASKSKAEKGIISAKGKLTQVNSTEKFLLIKIEKGLELTFFVDEETQIQVADEPKSLADFKPGDSVAFDYLYDQDYKKIIRSLRKEESAHA